jgi:hypothetical protein
MECEHTSTVTYWITVFCAAQHNYTQIQSQICLFAYESLHNTIQYDNRVFKSTQIISLNRAERTTAVLSWYHAIKLATRC